MSAPSPDFLPAHDVFRGGRDEVPGSGPLLFLLHGVFGSRRNWRSMARNLQARHPEWTVVSVDLRHHGESAGAPGPSDLSAAADDLARLGAHLGRHPDVVSGHSFGGKVALAYLERHPRDLSQVWVLDTPLGPGHRPNSPRSDGEVSRVIDVLRTLPGPFRHRAEAQVSLRERGLPPGLAAWLASDLAPDGEGKHHWRFELEGIAALLESYWATDFHPFLARPPASVEVVIADQSDRWTPAETARLERTSSTSAHLRVHHLPDAGHWLHVDDPQGLLRLFAAHLPSTEQLQGQRRQTA
jgi:esterase